ncbi:hypothetical protein RP20_CCG004567 [Aedes albopictus]|nr:hypothetical protein RP20_CCG004567 [Aedes albopictus]
MNPKVDKDYCKTLQSEGVSTSIDGVTDSQSLHLPEWYDEAKFKHAQNFYRRNAYALVVVALYGLVASMALPSILSVLMFTKRSSSVLTAYRRYMATILHFVGWYTEELKPGTKYWKSLEFVRRAHSTTSRRANSKSPGMIISQRDMVIVQFSFVGYVVLSPRMLGIQYNTEDMEAFVHFWRVMGYMLGIEDRFNVCTADLPSTRNRMQQVRDLVIQPGLATTVGEDFRRMTRYMLDGMWYFNVFVNPDATLYFTYRLSGVPGYKDLSGKNYEKLSLYSRMMLRVLVAIHEVSLGVAVLRWLQNSLVYVLVNYGIQYFPVLAIIRFGFKNAIVRI